MPDFREAWEIQRVVDAIVRSARERRWLDIAEV
jgi:predicted dehydrogenase